MIETDPNYWDCECKKRYIHHKFIPTCSLCNTQHDEQPDSRPNEIASLGANEILIGESIEGATCGGGYNQGKVTISVKEGKEYVKYRLNAYDLVDILKGYNWELEKQRKYKYLTNPQKIT